MPYSYAKLRGRIVEKFDTQNKFAKAIDVSTVTVSKKMKGKVEFTQEDIVKWSEALDIQPEEYVDYFFA